MTTVTICEVQDIDLHLQKLNDVQLKKVQELSEVSAQIAQKHAFIEVLVKQITTIFGSQEKFLAIEEPLNDFMRKFEIAFCEKKDVRGVASEGFSDAKNYEFNFIKVAVVRYYFEVLLVANLVERYEKCLQELVEING